MEVASQLKVTSDELNQMTDGGDTGLVSNKAGNREETEEETFQGTAEFEKLTQQIQEKVKQIDPKEATATGEFESPSAIEKEEAHM